MGRKKGTKQSPAQDLEEAKDEDLKDDQNEVEVELVPEETFESEDPIESNSPQDKNIKE
jgi:hypothetical protein